MGTIISRMQKKNETSNQLPTPLGLTTSKPICIFEPAIDHFRQRFERPKEKPHSCGQQKDIPFTVFSYGPVRYLNMLFLVPAKTGI